MLKARLIAVSSLSLLLMVPSLAAKDLRLSLPKRALQTPVQKLNREGVQAVKKHHYAKAKGLFYRAYLLDPNDPFTLNNLGYIAEMEGDVDRAQRYYELSAANESEAIVDKSNFKEYEGKTVAMVAGHADEGPMMVNRINVEAISLLNKDRAIEAETLLQKALKQDPRNPFTLNNLGFAKEKQGELESALTYYNQAAGTGSREAVVVTDNAKWRGKRIADIAADNARKVQRVMESSSDVAGQVARLNLRGVSALNRNDRKTARNYFEQAYRLKQTDAFTLNNMGYLAELDGDKETADFYYERAKAAERADATIAVATRKEAEGKPLEAVANTNEVAISSEMEAATEARRRAGGEVLLKRRNNTPVIEPDKPVNPSKPQ